MNRGSRGIFLAFRVFRPSVGHSQLPNRELLLRGQTSKGVKLYHHYHVKARPFVWLGFEIFSVFLQKHYTAHSPSWTDFSSRYRVHICNMPFMCLYKPRLPKPIFRSTISFTGNEPVLLTPVGCSMGYFYYVVHPIQSSKECWYCARNVETAITLSVFNHNNRNLRHQWEGPVLPCSRCCVCCNCRSRGY